jgi:hypothetical protein
MTTNTHTNGKRGLGALVDAIRGKPLQVSAPTPTPTEPSQARSGRTRATNNERFTNIEAEAAATRADMRTLLDMVRPLVQPSQPATTPQAPAQAAKPAATRTPRRPRRQAATTPRAQARGEFSPVNKRAVDIALAAKGCGCTAAFTRTIWAEEDLQPKADERGISYVNGEFARNYNRSIMQVFCAHQVEQTGTDAPTPEVTAPAPTQADEILAKLRELLS